MKSRILVATIVLASSIPVSVYSMGPGGMGGMGGGGMGGFNGMMDQFGGMGQQNGMLMDQSNRMGGYGQYSGQKNSRSMFDYMRNWFGSGQSTGQNMRFPINPK